MTKILLLFSFLASVALFSTFSSCASAPQSAVIPAATNEEADELIEELCDEPSGCQQATEEEAKRFLAGYQ